MRVTRRGGWFGFFDVREALTEPYAELRVHLVNRRAAVVGRDRYGGTAVAFVPWEEARLLIVTKAVRHAGGQGEIDYYVITQAAALAVELNADLEEQAA